MKLYLMRHAESEWGESLDPTRALTSIGLKQISDMADFMVKQVGRVDLVISSWFKRARDTAEPMADALGNAPREEVSTLDPDGKPVDAWSDIKNLAEIHGSQDVLVVTHHPLINELVESLCGARTDDLSFHHGAIAHLDTATEKLHWLIGPPQVEHAEDTVLEAAIGVTGALLESLGLHVELDERKGGNKQGSYYYDVEGVKRWVLGDGGASGNCDLCEENADAGWIPEDEPYPNADEPPQHPHCTCEEETKEKRVRVYV